MATITQRTETGPQPSRGVRSNRRTVFLIALAWSLSFTLTGFLAFVVPRASEAQRSGRELESLQAEVTARQQELREESEGLQAIKTEIREAQRSHRALTSTRAKKEASVRQLVKQIANRKAALAAAAAAAATPSPDISSPASAPNPLPPLQTCFQNPDQPGCPNI